MMFILKNKSNNEVQRTVDAESIVKAASIFIERGYSIKSVSFTKSSMDELVLEQVSQFSA